MTKKHCGNCQEDTFGVSESPYSPFAGMDVCGKCLRLYDVEAPPTKEEIALAIKEDEEDRTTLFVIPEDWMEKQ